MDSIREPAGAENGETSDFRRIQADPEAADFPDAGCFLPDTPCAEPSI
ncbi:MAG: hypothetical protein ABEL04_12635 [Salinibacter sp.]